MVHFKLWKFTNHTALALKSLTNTWLVLLLSLLNEDTSVYLDAIISLRASALGPVDHGYVSGYKKGSCEMYVS